MNKNKLPEVKEKGMDVAEMLSFIKSQGYVMEPKEEWQLEYMLMQCKMPLFKSNGVEGRK